MKIFLSACFLLLFVWSPCLKAENAEDVKFGVIRIDINLSHPVVLTNGEEWEEQFFEKAGKTLVIEGISRDIEHTIALTPREDDYKPETVIIAPPHWKLVRVDKQTRAWQVNKTLNFRKWKKGERDELENKSQIIQAEEAVQPPSSAEPPPEEPESPTQPPQTGETKESSEPSNEQEQEQEPSMEPEPEDPADPTPQ